MSLPPRIRAFVDAARVYTPADLARRLHRRLAHEARSVGLRRDLDAPFDPPPSRVSLRVRPLEERDVPALLGPPEGGEPEVEASARGYRLRMLAGGLDRCYVAVTRDGTPCFMQWVLTAADQQKARRVLGDVFPEYGPDTVLLEGAYTPPRLRRLGAMPAATAAVAALGRSEGARWAITFIGESNTASIRGTEQAGFSPYLRRVERWHWLRRDVQFLPISEGAVSGRGAPSEQ